VLIVIIYATWTSQRTYQEGKNCLRTLNWLVKSKLIPKASSWRERERDRGLGNAVQRHGYVLISMTKPLQSVIQVHFVKGSPDLSFHISSHCGKEEEGEGEGGGGRVSEYRERFKPPKRNQGGGVNTR